MVRQVNVQQRHARDIAPSDFPKYGTRSMQAKFLLQYAILAPSGHNTQPWKFKIYDNKVDVFADVSKHLSVVDPHYRELVISCGAAIGIFQHAARFFGCTALCNFAESFSVEQPLATIELLAGPPPDEQEVRLFEAITIRATQRADFYELVPDVDDIDECRVIANKYNTDLYLECDIEMKSAIANLIANGDRAQYSNADFRNELSHWLKSKNIGNQDGISADSFGLPDILTPLGSLLVKTVNLGGSIGDTHAKQVTQRSAVIGLLFSHGDDLDCLLTTGISLSHMLLHLTSRGLSVSFYNEPIEISALRKELRKLTENKGQPQMLFRIGYGPEGKVSSRKHINDCIID